MESGNHKRKNSEVDSDDEEKSPNGYSPSTPAPSPAPSNSSKNSDSERTNVKLHEKHSKEETTKDTEKIYKKKNYHWIRPRYKEDSQGNIEHSPVEHPHKFYLRLCNLPKKLTFDELRDFINKEYEDTVDSFFMAVDNDNDFIGMIKLEFDTYEQCRNAYDKLNGKSIEEQEIVVDSWDSDDEYRQPRSLTCPPKKKIRLQTAPWRPDIDVFDEDPKGLYGFRPEFLASLGITPPIGRWLFVTNFRCDKYELKEAFGLAGEVLTIYIDTKNPEHKFAYVVYSHPIEAVQAVAMLNNQSYYGLKLKVEIEKYPPGDTLLPKGLSGLGRGLGKNGRPLRDVVNQYKRLARCQSTLVDTWAFQKPKFLVHDIDPDFGVSNDNDDEKQAPGVPKPEYMRDSDDDDEKQPPGVTKPELMHDTDWPRNTSSPANSNSGGSTRSGPMVRPNYGPNRHMQRPNIPMQGPNVPMQGPNVPMQRPNLHMQGPNVPMRGPCVPMQGPNVPMVGPRPGYNVPQTMHQIPTIGPRPIGTMMNPAVRAPALVEKGSVTVEISNLPLSTSFPLLCEKMSACGQVLSLQLTAPGAATVQYANKDMAIHCYRQYNQCCVQGNILTVRFL